MKILFHIPTQTLVAYPRADDEPVVGLDPDYEIFDVIQQSEPFYNTATQYLSTTETIDTTAKTVTRGWQIIDLPDYKIWANAQGFMAEFTTPEKADIAVSVDPTIASLRLELSTWFSEIYANDYRVIAGLNRMVQLNILTETRKNDITTI
jgi:hypothetical protein